MHHAPWLLSVPRLAQLVISTPSRVSSCRQAGSPAASSAVLNDIRCGFLMQRSRGIARRHRRVRDGVIALGCDHDLAISKIYRKCTPLGPNVLRHVESGHFPVPRIKRFADASATAIASVDDIYRAARVSNVRVCSYASAGC